MARENYFEMPIAKLEGRLSARERAFVEYYDESGNGTQAAQRAGYSPDDKNAAAVAASRLLRRDKIIAYRRARAHELYERLGLSPETLANKLEALYRRAMGGDPVMVYNEDKDKYEVMGSYDFDGRAAAKALELQGELIGAYEQKVSGTMRVGGVEEYLAGLDSAGEVGGGDAQAGSGSGGEGSSGDDAGFGGEGAT